MLLFTRWNKIIHQTTNVTLASSARRLLLIQSKTSAEGSPKTKLWLHLYNVYGGEKIRVFFMKTSLARSLSQKWGSSKNHIEAPTSTKNQSQILSTSSSAQSIFSLSSSFELQFLSEPWRECLLLMRARLMFLIRFRSIFSSFSIHVAVVRGDYIDLLAYATRHLDSHLLLISWKLIYGCEEFWRDCLMRHVP